MSTSSIAIARTPPFGRPTPEICHGCGELFSSADPMTVQLAVRDTDPVSFHPSCFSQYLGGLVLFATALLPEDVPQLIH